MGAAIIESMCRHTGLKTLETQQQLLLLTLYIQGEVNQTDLPKLVGVEKSAVSRAIYSLGAGSAAKLGAGWIESYADPCDRRYQRVRLSKTGRALLDAVAADVARRYSIPERVVSRAAAVA